jgi:phosphatidylglycerol---prolipoprotein diacylglyceryl transferase
MLRTVFLIPAEVAGCPVFGFGLLLALWAVASVITLVWLVRRQGFNADPWGYVPILLLMGAIIAWLLPAIGERNSEGVLLGLPIRGYGMMMLTAVVAGTLLAVWRAKRVGLDPDLILTLIFWMLVPGVVGARAFYVIEYWQHYREQFLDGPGGSVGTLIGSILNITEGGLVVYGSFFGGVLGILLFIRKYRLPLLALCDLIAPCMLLGLAIGRVGCLLNGCCFGAVCDHAWAIEFPAGTPPGFSVPYDEGRDDAHRLKTRTTILSHLSPAYEAQLSRGQFYGFKLSENPKSEPCTVLSVTADSAADRAGLKAGDQIVGINGWEVATAGNASKAIEDAFFAAEPLDVRVKDRPTVTIAAISSPPKKSLPVQPSQPLSSIDALLLCLLLLAYDPFRRRDGELFAVMMSIYPVTRFLIEGLRSDEAPVLGTGLSIGQWVSLLLLACAATLWFYILRRPRGLASFSPRPLGEGPGVRAALPKTRKSDRP